ncbi:MULTISPECIES: mannose-1-phosphate guanylyltransferase/mannose-6-phosphate isomerase [Psychrilyobacter]|uniref:mannose-1-phosphate guanylyltransferase n=1 Tax=Psychrilyobacter piezotolerans TaxID=2293438 RepID=A0ABX9KKX4_9FUSO|nr:MULTISPECIES: mannose-1-phosphate guanylyltransferase/mannose-6-phosphate isomerase [Psychrilyobacter]MCS5420421.1 mannose-1-phosphate guanylyltransferase/mannose-6-phosphate isomerase [Psychrilyobacter sp. S5]NDI76431.1 mannose-1-phosphate guanylyltransferase/mannose-6-phosphate isomerase [Psychrilyobacter piezotolerans]RDE66027.1 mannose-1-phosphate guanylyltransferase/mannose-6-phosphate isomerase [Psychrilyobacter sp. S5]REI43205.1 mannose-1-phosphate guanylyltransferase/mannose-6-phosph
MKNIILCGGNGTRLWPVSRTLMPKQFVKLFNDQSLFQLTVERNNKVCDSNFIISNTEQYFLAIDQLEEDKKYNFQNAKFLLEPVGRNTAPAIALACFDLDPNEIVLVTPSDHLIKDEYEYEKGLSEAKRLAEEDNLVTFGITPGFAETGFGYIESELPLAPSLDKDGEQVRGFAVKAFHEKPNFETATKYLEAGNYYWNSGMFCFKAGVFLEELKKYSPEIYEASKTAYEGRVSLEEKQMRIKMDDMLNIPHDSIDYAVMEKSKIVKVIPSDIKWSDVGSFDALAEELPNDENNNFVLTKKQTELIDVEDLIVVDTEDALLISKKGSSQKIKERVVRLKKEGSALPDIHLKAHRPWGTYEVLVDTPGYKVKRIEVKPGKRLSLQKHFHRNEHWIVVSGTATVTVGDEVKLVRPNESTYIKMGQVHRLSNEGKIPVVMIEAQVGEYTGEDDIVRLEDDFARN